MNDQHTEHRFNIRTTWTGEHGPSQKCIIDATRFLNETDDKEIKKKHEVFVKRLLRFKTLMQDTEYLNNNSTRFIERIREEKCGLEQREEELKTKVSNLKRKIKDVLKHQHAKDIEIQLAKKIKELPKVSDSTNILCEKEKEIEKLKKEKESIENLNETNKNKAAAIVDLLESFE